VNYTVFIIPTDNAGNEIGGPAGTSLAIRKDATIDVFCYQSDMVCDDNLLFIFPDLRYTNYRLIINLEMLPPLKNFFAEAFFYVTASNPRFSVFLIAVRSFLLLLSLVFGAFYLRFYSAAPIEDRTFEHHYIMVLSVALVMLNDPIYSLSVLFGYLPLVVFSTLYIAVFFSLVFFFNLVMYKRMHSEIGQRFTGLISNSTIAAALSFFSMIAAVLVVVAVYSRFDPTVDLEKSFKGLHLVVLYFGGFLFSVVLSLFMIHSSRIFEKWDQVLGRHKFFYFWNLFSVVMLVTMCSAGLYQNPQDDGIQIILVLVLCNYYVILLQFVWRFSDTKAPEIEMAVPAKDVLQDYQSEQQSVSQVEDLTHPDIKVASHSDTSVELQPYTTMDAGAERKDSE